MKLLFTFVILFIISSFAQSNPDGDRPSVHVMPYYMFNHNDVLHYEKPISSAPVVAFQAIFKYPFNKNNTLQFFFDYQPINYSFVPLNPPVKADDRLIKVDGYSRKLGIIFSYYF